VQNPRRLAVLIDGENAPSRIVGGLFVEIAKLGDAGICRIYGDFSGTRLTAWASVLCEHAIVPRHNFPCAAKKNATDIAMVIDAMDILHGGLFSGFCLVSSDSDFSRLASRIREQGLTVFGFGEHKAPKSFQKACHRFFFAEDFAPKNPAAPLVKK
jgi:NYN domain